MNKIKLFLVIGIGILFNSCESFTEVSMPQTQLTSVSVFEDASTANAALSDIYSRMRDNGVASGSQTGVTYLMGNYSDDLQFFGTNTNFEQFNKHTLIASNSYVLSLWTYTYGEIYAVNALLEGMKESVAIKGEQKDRLIGEALFLRAYLHFYLVNLYSDVPYIKTTDYKKNSVITKLPKTEVYANILLDLKEAELLLPDNYVSADRVRPNRGTVNSLLARVYLYTQEWEDCQKKATAVIENTLYVWEADLSGVFLKGSSSIIWSLHSGAAGQNTRDARSFAFSSGPPSKPALSPELYEAFETGDLRKSVWIKKIENVSGTWHHAFKYKKSSTTATSEEYTILFRLAEQYLIRAEARTHLGDYVGARADLNKVRNRAGLPNTEADNMESLLDAIIQERRVELFTEQGHRWFDLRRTDRASAALSNLKPGWAETDSWLPIPENELLLNDNLLPQNPGY